MNRSNRIPRARIQRQPVRNGLSFDVQNEARVWNECKRVLEDFLIFNPNSQMRDQLRSVVRAFEELRVISGDLLSVSFARNPAGIKYFADILREVWPAVEAQLVPSDWSAGAPSDPAVVETILEIVLSIRDAVHDGIQLDNLRSYCQHDIPCSAYHNQRGGRDISGVVKGACDKSYH